MISQLVARLLPSGTPGSRSNDRDPNTIFDVFHVEEARGSSLVPDQTISSEPFAFRSALGLGGLLSPTQVFVVVLFTNITVTHEIANVFRMIGPEHRARTPAKGRDARSRAKRADAYERVIRYHEQVTWSAHRQLTESAQRLSGLLGERQRFEALGRQFFGLHRHCGCRRARRLSKSSRPPHGGNRPHFLRNHDLDRRLLPPRCSAFMEEVVIPTTRRQEMWQGETDLKDWRTNTSIPVSDHHFTIRDRETRQLLGFGTVTRDISEKRRADSKSESASWRASA